MLYIVCFIRKRNQAQKQQLDLKLDFFLPETSDFLESGVPLPS